MAAWCYEGEIENCFVSWEDSDTDTDFVSWEDSDTEVVKRVCIKTIWCNWIFDLDCSWIKGCQNSGNTCPKKGKTLPQETLDLLQSFYEDDEYRQQMPGIKGLFLDDELSHLDKNSEFHFCQWQTADHLLLKYTLSVLQIYWKYTSKVYLKHTSSIFESYFKYTSSTLQVYFKYT